MSASPLQRKDWSEAWWRRTLALARYRFMGNRERLACWIAPWLWPWTPPRDDADSEGRAMRRLLVMGAATADPGGRVTIPISLVLSHDGLDALREETEHFAAEYGELIGEALRDHVQVITEGER